MSNDTPSSGLAEYSVQVQVTIVTTVQVRANSIEEAHSIVDRPDFELPSRDTWSAMKDFRYVVVGPDGEEQEFGDEQESP